MKVELYYKKEQHKQFVYKVEYKKEYLELLKKVNILLKLLQLHYIDYDQLNIEHISLYIFEDIFLQLFELL